MICVLVTAALRLPPAEKIARRARRRRFIAQLRDAVLKDKAERSERRGAPVERPVRGRPRRRPGSRS